MKHVADDVYVTTNAKMVLRTRSSAQSRHCHRPIELVAAIDGPLKMWCEVEGTLSANCFLIPPMRRHALAEYEGRIARIYLDSGYHSVAAWKGYGIRSDFEDHGELRAALIRLFDAKDRVLEARNVMRAWLDNWVDEHADVRPDPRVAQALRHLDEQGLGIRGDRQGMAELVGLSPSRFAAIFAAETGTSLSRYLIWRRVKIALSLICQGESVTAAAALAGFSDGAHLTRSCRATYGCPPSSITDLSVRYEDGTTRDATKHSRLCLGLSPPAS